MTKLIVGTALFAVRQDFVSLGRLFELGVCVGIIRVAVRVILHGDSPVGLFDLLIRGRAVNTKHFVIVAFRHKSGVGFYKRHAPSLKADAGSMVFAMTRAHSIAL